MLRRSAHLLLGAVLVLWRPLPVPGFVSQPALPVSPAQFWLLDFCEDHLYTGPSIGQGGTPICKVRCLPSRTDARGRAGGG